MTPINQAIAIFWRQSRRQFVEVTASDAALRLGIMDKLAAVELDMLVIAGLAETQSVSDHAGGSIRTWSASKQGRAAMFQKMSEDMV